MNIVKSLFGILYKVFVLIRERFFLIPTQESPPPQPSLFTGEGMGGLESSQISSESVTPATGIDAKEGDGVEEKESFVKKMEEREILIPTQELPPPQPSLLMGEGMGGFESSQISSESVTPTTGIDAKEGDGIEEKESFVQIMEAREIPPVLKNQRISLCETLDRVLNTGVVVHGDITISVANIDLIYISLRTLITSVETARQLQEKPE